MTFRTSQKGLSLSPKGFYILLFPKNIISGLYHLFANFFFFFFLAKSQFSSSFSRNKPWGVSVYIHIYVYECVQMNMVFSQ